MMSVPGEASMRTDGMGVHQGDALEVEELEGAEGRVRICGTPGVEKRRVPSFPPPPSPATAPPLPD